AVPIRGFPKGEYMVRVEQPRGEAIYYVKANGTKFLDRFRVRTPTFANVPAMIELMKGCRLSEIPMLILTIDPCVSCIER
ncbi:MAG TPA: NADH-quinone oxidoreductase subunit D, partial [Ruminococcaceae bacterium]|nr:NADH-quinone oxidoreductase subunit D [Oscillospiraceae bacterium]HCB92094.1 NADH-quinone oxidoreductase subunit D [Oscillospiraceae bacterium]